MWSYDTPTIYAFLWTRRHMSHLDIYYHLRSEWRLGIVDPLMKEEAFEKRETIRGCKRCIAGSHVVP
jgi:hypothetical protein